MANVERPPSKSVNDQLYDLFFNNYVWKSIFRSGYPNTPRNQMLVVATNVFLHLHPTRIHRTHVKITHTYCLGGLSFFMFLGLTVTGVLLMFYYVPSVERAYADIQALETNVRFGLLLRNLHRWMAHAMIILVLLHMMRVFYTGAYKPPREFNWVVGVILLVLTFLLLPAALGPARILGHHGRHHYGRICPGPGRREQVPPPRRLRGRDGGADPLLHAARHRATARHSHLHGGPLLANPARWRHGAAALAAATTGG